jgi:dihydropteroate synthase
MGILNVTPDSFSDGGRYLDPGAAIAQGERMITDGADIVDVGGESTRPGAQPVDEAEERRRVLPVVAALADRVRVSIDTRKASVAEAALAEGATMVNDVSASLHEVAAAGGAAWVAMHMQGDPTTMQDDPTYGDVVAEVRDHLVERAERGRAAGVNEVWIDPGIGFGKRDRHNLALLGHLDQLAATGFPVLVGTSRKAFLARLVEQAEGRADGAPATMQDRIEGSLATATWAMSQGAAMVRVHDVRPSVEAARVVAGSVGDGEAGPWR